MTDDKFILRIDENEFTIGDLEDFEEATGVELTEALSPVGVKDEDGNKVFDEKGRPVKEVKVSAKALKALIWITKRRDTPGFTLDDARNVKIKALEVVALGAESDPKETSA